MKIPPFIFFLVLFAGLIALLPLLHIGTYGPSAAGRGTYNAILASGYTVPSYENWRFLIFLLHTSFATFFSVVASIWAHQRSSKEKTQTQITVTTILMMTAIFALLIAILKRLGFPAIYFLVLLIPVLGYIIVVYSCGHLSQSRMANE